MKENLHPLTKKLPEHLRASRTTSWASWYSSNRLRPLKLESQARWRVRYGLASSLIITLLLRVNSLGSTWFVHWKISKGSRYFAAWIITTTIFTSIARKLYGGLPLLRDRYSRYVASTTTLTSRLKGLKRSSPMTDPFHFRPLRQNLHTSSRQSSIRCLSWLNSVRKDMAMRTSTRSLRTVILYKLTR